MLFAAIIGGLLGLVLFDWLSGGSPFAYALAALGGIAVGSLVVTGLMKVVLEIGDVTGLADEESRFPRLRKFFDSFSLRNEP